MVVRGRLAFDDQGRLVEIAEDAQDPTNPTSEEIDPVEFEELIAQTAGVQDLDAAQLVSSLDANGFDVSNVGTLGTEVSNIGQFAAVVSPASDQNYSSSNWETLQIDDVAREDTDVFSVDTTNHAISVQEGGSYAISGHVGINDDSADQIFQLRTAGSFRPQRLARRDTTRGDEVIPLGTAFDSLTAGDSFSLEVYNEDANPTIRSDDRTTIIVWKLG